MRSPDIIDEVRAERGIERPIGISVDEWNVWNQTRWNEVDKPQVFTGDWPEAPRLIEDEYTALDAAVVGSLLISLISHADRVTMANLAQLVNVIAPIRSEPGGAAWRQPTYFPFADAAHHARGRVIRPRIESAPIETAQYGAVPSVSSVATLDENRLALFAVNRNLTDEQTVTFSAPGRVVSASVLASADGDVRATNGPGAERVAPRDLAVTSAQRHAHPRASRRQLGERAHRTRRDHHPWSESVTRFTIGAEDFLLDDAPFRILAGSIHYFRVHPEHWADRIRKARLMGLNTIETYVAWNAHEPHRGEWDATGWNDLGAFLDAVAAEGMYAIVRPGPYICAEWHNGGLPVWLTNTPGIGLRRSEPQYVAAVTDYLEKVYEIVAPRQIDRGGNVILVQIENEYGAYGSDTDYLEELVRVTETAGITVPLTTVDQPTPEMLQNGSLPDPASHGIVRIQGRPSASRRSASSSRPGPSCARSSGTAGSTGGAACTTRTSAEASAAELEDLLAAGASVTIYMFHGGTNFGTTNGANDKGRYAPIVTSYDYDAPLDESGNPTDKFHAFRRVIARYAEVPDEVPAPAQPAPEFSVELEREGDWLEAALGAQFEGLVTFDDLDHVGPVIRYRTVLPGATGGLLTIGEVRDLAWVRVDGVEVGRLSRTLHERALRIPAGRELEIVVEDQGRVNYDIRLGEPKGLIGGVQLDGVPLTGWTTAAVDLTRALSVPTDAVADSPAGTGGRERLHGSFDLDASADLFLDTAEWGKGFAFVNGFFLGRFWSGGPQRTLYVPAPVTQAGANEIVVLTLDAASDATARFVEAALLGPAEE